MINHGGWWYSTVFSVSSQRSKPHSSIVETRRYHEHTHCSFLWLNPTHAHTHTPHCCRLIHICCPKEYLQQFLSPVWVTTKLQSPAVQEEATWQLVKVYQLLSGADLLVKWPTLAYKVCEVYPAAQKVRSYWSGQETGQSLGNSLLWELTTADTRVTHSPRCDMRRESRWLRRKRLNDGANGTTSSSEGEHNSSIKNLHLWQFQALKFHFMQFFLDSHLSNVTAEKFNRKESLRAQCPHHCFLFIQFNYHLLLTYSWPNFIFMYQRSEWPHLKSDSLPCLRFSLLVI